MSSFFRSRKGTSVSPITTPGVCLSEPVGILLPANCLNAKTISQASSFFRQPASQLGSFRKNYHKLCFRPREKNSEEPAHLSLRRSTRDPLVPRNWVCSAETPPAPPIGPLSSAANIKIPKNQQICHPAINPRPAGPQKLGSFRKNRRQRRRPDPSQAPPTSKSPKTGTSVTRATNRQTRWPPEIGFVPQKSPPAPPARPLPSAANVKIPKRPAHLSLVRPTDRPAGLQKLGSFRKIAASPAGRTLPSCFLPQISQ